MRSIVPITTALLFSGCVAVGPDYEAPTAVVPEEWRESDHTGFDASAPALSEWWTHLDDPMLDTLIEQVGVCRDFAHLLIALCRAVNIPARFATGTDYGADPALGPADFHAYVEVYLGDRWYIFDPSGTAIPMGFVRFGTGRDAADVAFATIFGAVKSDAPVIQATAMAVDGAADALPRHCSEALSTDGATIS